MRTGRTAMLAVSVLAVALAAPAARAQDSTVQVLDNRFDPATLTVEAGTTVTWEHGGAAPHTVTAADGSFDSHPGCNAFGDPCMNAGDRFEFTFEQPGDYAYYCKLHGTAAGEGMAGTIRVVAAGQDTGAEQPTEPAPAVTGSLEASDQTGDGRSVVVDRATIQGSAGFVVIHADQDGAPGPVLGHVAIPQGTSTNVRVPLDTPLTASATVWPMLHVDAGQPGVYEFPGPDGPVMADGAVVVLSLAYTVSAVAPTEQLPETGAAVLVLVALAAAAIGAGAWMVRTRRARAA